MSTFQNTLHEFVDVLKVAPDFEHVSAASEAIFSVEPNTTEELNLAVEILAPFIESSSHDVAGIVVTLVAGFVSSGADLGDVWIRIERTIPDVLSTAVQYLLETRKIYVAENPDVACDICNAEHFDDIDFFTHSIREKANEIDPRFEEAWIAVDLFCQPALFFLAVDEDARLNANRIGLGSPLRELGKYFTNAHWLGIVVSMKREELHVIDPIAKTGFTVVIDNVADNFQLHTLLAGALISTGLVSGESPTPEEVAAATDADPQDGVGATGVWNLHRWDGLLRDGSIPTTGCNSWIWNEGAPWEIPEFDGTKVVLLGPPTYKRTWAAGRIFSNFHGSIEVTDIWDVSRTRGYLDALVEAVVRLEKEHAPKSF